MLDAARQQKEHVREIYEAVEDLTTALVWNTPGPRASATVVAMLQTRLAAVGWPVSLPTTAVSRSLRESEQRGATGCRNAREMRAFA